MLILIFLSRSLFCSIHYSAQTQSCCYVITSIFLSECMKTFWIITYLYSCLYEFLSNLFIFIFHLKGFTNEGIRFCQSSWFWVSLSSWAFNSIFTLWRQLTKEEQCHVINPTSIKALCIRSSSHTLKVLAIGNSPGWHPVQVSTNHCFWPSYKFFFFSVHKRIPCTKSY